MVGRDHPRLLIGRHCALLSNPPSSFCRTLPGDTDQNLALMPLIVEEAPDTPFFGLRQMTSHLRNEGHKVNEKHMRRRKRLIGLMPICQKPDTSRPAKGQKICPRFLRGSRVEGQARTAAWTSPACPITPRVAACHQHAPPQEARGSSLCAGLDGQRKGGPL